MPKIYWVTGLPGSGKTTFAHALRSQLLAANRTVIHLDGDDLRNAFLNIFSYERDDRVSLGKIYLNLAVLINKQNCDVIVSTVSLFKEVQVYLNTLRKDHEIVVILIDASLELLEERNQKSLREKSTLNSPGVTMNIEFPEMVDVVLMGNESSEDQAIKIKELLGNE